MKTFAWMDVVWLDRAWALRILASMVLWTAGEAACGEPDSIWISAVAESAPGSLPDLVPDASADEEEREPEGPLTLPQAQRLALKQNPELAASTWEVRTRQGRAAQAALRPNPELDVEVEDFGGSSELRGTSSAESTFSLSQAIETRGKRPKRKKAAEMDTEVARWDYELARRRVLAEVGIAFASVLAAQERVSLSEELVKVASASGTVAGRLVEAGAAPAVERTRAAVEAGLARVELASAQRALVAARVQLAATWGGEVASFDRAVGELGRTDAPEAIDVLRARLSENPMLRRWDREVLRRASVVELEDAQGIPNVVARAGVRRVGEVDENAFVASISVPFPIFDRNQGSREAARSDVRRAGYERRAAEIQLSSQLTTAYQEVLSRYGEVSELRTTILPSAEEAFEGVRRGFERGLFRNLDVLDAQRRLFELRIREIEALRSYHSAKAVVDQLASSEGSSPMPSGRANP